MTIPFITNRFPIANEPNALPTTNISFAIADADGDLRINGLQVWIKGNIALESDGYDGYSFVSPYNGPGSSLLPTTIDGYDGYAITIDSYNQFSNVVSVRAIAEDSITQIDGYWAFIVGAKVNTLYFCDGYGLKSVDISNLVGESQSIVRIVSNINSIPWVPNNEISSISGNLVDGYFCMALSYADSYDGTVLFKNETWIQRYSVGVKTDRAQINTSGIMYLINKDSNSIDVYYGVHFREGYRSPDFSYNVSSTPAIVSGEITSLHIVSGVSTKYSGSTRLYIGTTTGLTRIETYDKQTDGYCDGYDNRGVAINYGIAGSGYTHEVIGGTISRVAAIGSDDTRGVMFVGTNDGYGNGGLTQIAVPGNRKILYMTKATGFLPSNDIRDIFGTGY